MGSLLGHPFALIAAMFLSLALGPLSARAGDPIDFNTQLNALEPRRQDALAQGDMLGAAKLSREIGQLYVAHDQRKDGAVVNFKQAADLYAGLGRDALSPSSQRIYYNAALENLRDALANADKPQVAAPLKASIAALQAEMKQKKVPIEQPKPPPDEPAEPPREPPSTDPTELVPYAGPSSRVALPMVKHIFSVAVPNVFETASELDDIRKILEVPLKGAPELRKARGIIAKNYMVSLGFNQLDADPNVGCSGPAGRVKHERIKLNGTIPACLGTTITRGYSDLARADAVSATFWIYFEYEGLHFRLLASATLESKDPATPKLLGAVDAMVRSLRLEGAATPPPEACKDGEQRVLDSRSDTFEYADDDSKVFFSVSKDNDSGVAAAKGMAAFWKAGTAVMSLIVDALPPAAGKSGIGVGFVIDYLKKGGEILERLATSPLTRRANEVKAELYVVTSKVVLACEIREVCSAGRWIRQGSVSERDKREGGFRAVKRASKGDTEWGRIETVSTPDIVDLDRLEAWSSAFLANKVAEVKTKKAAVDIWKSACR